MRLTPQKWIGLVVTIAFASITNSVQARDSYFEPITSFEAGYTDNITLSLDNPRSETRGRLNLGLDYTSAESPNDRFSVGVLAQVDRYTDGSLDTENYLATLDYFKGTPRRDFDLGFRIRHHLAGY